MSEKKVILIKAVALATPMNFFFIATDKINLIEKVEIIEVEGPSELDIFLDGPTIGQYKIPSNIIGTGGILLLPRMRIQITVKKGLVSACEFHVKELDE